MDSYLLGLLDSKVRSMKELVDWNVEHSDEALPSGTTFAQFELLNVTNADQNTPARRC